MKPLRDYGSHPLLLWPIIMAILSLGVGLFKKILPFQFKTFHISIILLNLCALIMSLLIYYLMNARKKLNDLSGARENFLSNYTDPIMMINNGIIDYVNDEIYEILEFPHKNLLNTSIFSLISSEDNDAFLNFLSCKCSKEIVVAVTKGNKNVKVRIKKLSYTGRRAYMLSLVLHKREERSEELKDSFICNISHEFGTPINVLYTALQLQEKYIEDMSMADIKKYNKVMRKNCQRLIRLTNNIIDIGKIEQGALKPKLNFMNIVPIVEETSLSIVDFASKRNMEIVFDTEKEELFVNCDVYFVQRIILNLLSNCIKYGTRGSIININIGLYPPNFMYIKIKNRGEGIEKGARRSAFHCFHKGDTSLSRSKEGAGVGLYIAKSLVELQGGKLFLTGSEKEETEVYVLFPIMDKLFDERIDNTSLLALEEKYIKEKAAIELSDIYT